MPPPGGQQIALKRTVLFEFRAPNALRLKSEAPRKMLRGASLLVQQQGFYSMVQMASGRRTSRAKVSKTRKMWFMLSEAV
jgi:hypothetical protein